MCLKKILLSTNLHGTVIAKRRSRCGGLCLFNNVTLEPPLDVRGERDQARPKRWGEDRGGRRR